MMSTKKRRKVSNVEARSERIAIRLKPSTKEKAVAAAEAEDATLSKWIERLVREALGEKPRKH